MRREAGQFLPDPVAFPFEIVTDGTQQTRSEQQRLLPLAPDLSGVGVTDAGAGGQRPVGMQKQG